MSDEKAYFTVSELSQRFGITEDAVLALSLKFQVHFTGRLSEQKDNEPVKKISSLYLSGMSFILEIEDLFSGYAIIPPESMPGFMGKKDEAVELMTLCQRNQNGTLKYFLAATTHSPVTFPTYRVSSLFVDKKEVMSFEEQEKSKGGQLTLSPEVPSSSEQPLPPREKRSYLHIIGGLLDIIKGHYDKELPVLSQEGIIDLLVGELKGQYSGISKRNLEAKFAEANRAMDNPDLP